MNIVYSCNKIPPAAQVIELYQDAGLARPIDDYERIQQMISNSNLFVSAWHNGLLVGLARSLTDFAWCCYLSDLAVRNDYKKSGIGKNLIQLTKEKAGEQSMVLLLSVPDAMDYYLKVGFSKCENSFIMQRAK